MILTDTSMILAAISMCEFSLEIKLFSETNWASYNLIQI